MGLQANQQFDTQHANRANYGLGRDELGLRADQQFDTQQASRANYGLNRDALKLQGAEFGENARMNRGRLDLEQRDFALAAPGRRARTAVQGDTLANAQDVQVGGARIPIPQISGGLRPSMRSENTRALGRDMSRTALLGQMQGDTFEKPPALEVPDVQNYQWSTPEKYRVSNYQWPTPEKYNVSNYDFPSPQIPTITPPQRAGRGDTALNLFGLAGAGLELYDEYGRRRTG